MPNIKSAMKSDEKSKLQNLKNKAEKSALKTNLKKFDAAVAEGNRDAAVSTYKVAVQAVDRAAGKGLIHKNNAAHKKCDGSENERAWLIHRIGGMAVCHALFATPTGG